MGLSFWLHIGQKIRKLLHIDRFYQMVVEAGIERGALVFFLAPPGLGYKHSVFKVRILMKRAAYIISAHTRQAYIHENNIGMFVLGRFDGGLAVMNQNGLMT